MSKQINLLKETVDTFDSHTGEVLHSEKAKAYMVASQQEDDYVKVYKYTTTVFAFKGIPLSLVPAVLEISKYMSYAEKGQLVCFNKIMREQICQTLDISLKRLDQIVKQLKEADVLRPAGARGLYAMNPFLVGAGSAVKIHELRAKFDFEADKLITESETTNYITGERIREIVTEASKDKKQIPGQMSIVDTDCNME